MILSAALQRLMWAMRRIWRLTGTTAYAAPELREFAKLERIALIGQGNRFELWD